MTWAEFKRAVEGAGVRDDDSIDWIDVSAGFGGGPEEVMTSIETLKDGTRQFSVSG